ncbi:MAG TPA: DUF6531 domain-containing protein, partial [Candidatus Sulfomarinibacteraceae bacterium]|nr:DUF6531 domain-containing protein [Candidatus Sulfomarinibacteraceae bacterium]
ALTLSRTDLVLPAPGMDVVLGRDYSSAGIRWGLFGWGWELAGLQRLRPNPDGTVDLCTSWGDRFVFGNSTGHPGANTSTLTSWGHPGELKKKADGSWYLLRPDGGYTEFSADGYPTAIRDRHRQSTTTGSELRFHWHADGTLAQIEQVNGTFSQVERPRTLTFAYKDEVPGVVSSVEDSVRRVYHYEYDSFGRLKEARIEGIQVAHDGASGNVLEQYGRLPGNPAAATVATLEGGSLLDEVRESKAESQLRTILDPTYDTSEMLHPVTRLSRGQLETGQLAYAIDAEGDSGATVSDDAGVTETVLWDEIGRPEEITRGGTQTTRIIYVTDSLDPLEKTITLPTGGRIENTWDFEKVDRGTRRAAFNLRETTRYPDPDGTIGTYRTLSTPPFLTTTYTYDTLSNQPVLITLPEGADGDVREWEIKRQLGEPWEIYDPLEHKTTIGIDGLGRRATVTDAAGNTTIYRYDDPTGSGFCNPQGSGELCQIEGPGGTLSDELTNIIYDDFGNPKRIERPAGNPYGRRPMEHAVRNALGWVLESWVDGSQSADTAAPLRSFHAAYTYDHGGRLERVVKQTGNGVVTVVHETFDSGLPHLRTVAGGGGDQQMTIDYRYHTGGHLASVVEQTSDRATYYEPPDSLGRPTARRVTAAGQNLVTTWVYDRPDDLPTRIELPGDDVVTLQYDPFGRANWQQDALLRQTISDVDGGGRVLSTEIRRGGDVVHRESASYNAADQPEETTVERFRSDAGSRLEVTAYAYDDPADPRGLLYQVTDAEGRVTTFGYDASGRRSVQQLYDETTVSTLYWGSGQPATVTENPRDGSQIYQTYHEYDTVGLPSLSLSPSGELETRYGYDGAGRMEWLFAPGGQTTHWTRSPLGMVTRRDQTGRPGVTTTLNLAARELVHQDTAAGAVAVARFDEAGRVVYQLDAAGVARELQWRPDGTLDHVSVLGDSGYTQVTYGHDAGNRLRSITVAAAPEIPDTAGWPLAVEFDYDALDNLTLASDDRGVAVSRVVWSTGEAVSETLTVDGREFTTSADYDRTFLPETITYPDASTVGLVRADRLGRLSALTVDGEPVWSQLYSGLRRGAGSTGALDTSRTYDFDARPVTASAAVGGSQRFLLERGYNDAGRFETQRTQAGTEALATLSHDAGL